MNLLNIVHDVSKANQFDIQENNMAKNKKSNNIRKKRYNVALIACDRCKSRKQKCNGNFSLLHSKCSNCRKAGTACEYNQKRTPNYLKSLEQKVEFLENKLKFLEHRENVSSLEEVDQTVSNDKISPKRISTNIESPWSLTKCAALIPLKNDTEPYFVGSLTFNVASLLQSCLAAEFDNANIDQSIKKHRPAIDSNDISPAPFDKSTELYSWMNISLDEIILDDNLTSSYLDLYFKVIHSRYPFLQRQYVEKLHKNRHQLLYNDYSSDSGLDKSENISAAFTLIMSYAIGSRVSSSTLKTENTDRDNNKNNLDHHHLVLYTHAIKFDLSTVFEQKNISNITSMLLVVIYHLRYPNGPAIWDLIGSTLRLCVNFGLHRKDLDLLHENPYAYLQKSRIFWSAYSLERTISTSFGRPFSLDDRDIDVDLPIDVDENVVDSAILRRIYQAYSQYSKVDSKNDSDIKNNGTKQQTTLTMAIHHFKLKRIESNIQSIIYRVDKEFDRVPREEIKKLTSSMKSAIFNLPAGLSSYDYDYYLYLFNKQIRSMLQPFISKLSLDDPLFIECMTASLTICQTSKKIHLTYKRRLSFVGLQTLFLSGVTVIYGLLSKKLTWNIEVSEALRSCSSVLYLVSERASSCSKFRDMFERLLEMVHGLNLSTEYRPHHDVPSHNIGLFHPASFSLSPCGLDFQNAGPASSDLFGQGQLKQRFQNRIRNNLDLFNKITNTNDGNSDSTTKEFEKLFDLSNIENLGSERLDTLVKKVWNNDDFLKNSYWDFDLL